MDEIYINGQQVDYFCYDEGKKEVNAINLKGQVIAAFKMSKHQWNKLNNHRNGWKKMGILFGDPEED